MDLNAISSNAALTVGICSLFALNKPAMHAIHLKPIASKTELT